MNRSDVQTEFGILSKIIEKQRNRPLYYDSMTAEEYRKELSYYIIGTYYCENDEQK